MQLFESSKAYKIVEGDSQAGRLSHAYLLVSPDAKNLRGWLKELAAVLLGADARAARLIAQEQYSDCRIFPSEGEKAGVAEVRAMLDDVYIKPVEGTKKVFVLDNVQDMLASAQNKLLKVLEEPPENVYFLLGATSEFPVLTTVKSRTKRLDLAGFTEEETERYLREKYPHRTDAKEIAAVSGGILSKADELAQAPDASGQEAARLLSVLSPAAIPAEARKVTDRQEASRLLSAMRLILRDALVLKTGGAAPLTATDAQTLRRIAGRYSAAGLVRAQEKITQTEKYLKFNANVSMSLEELFVGILEGR